MWTVSVEQNIQVAFRYADYHNVHTSEIILWF